MSTRYHGPFKYMGNFKAIAADYEYYLSLSDEPVSVCLTERQMYILSVWNTYTPWMTRWYNTDDVSAQQLAIIAAEIEDLLMCGCGVPAPSLTDYLNSITYNNATSTSYGDTYNTWNTAGQTVASIAPDLDYGTGDPVDISRVICATLALLLKTIAQAAQATQQGTLNEAQDLTRGLTTVFGGLATAGSAGIAIGGGAAAVVGFFGGPWLVLGLALAAVGTGIASLIQGASPAAFTDQSALDDVLCVMQKNTYDENMTETVFRNALTPNSLTGPAAEFATVVQAYLNDQTTYLQFMVASQGFYSAANVAGLPDCACLPDRQSMVYDFLVSTAGWMDGVFGSTWTIAKGWHYNTSNNISIYIPAVPFDVYQVDVELTNYDASLFYATSSTGYAPQTGRPNMPPGIIRTSSFTATYKFPSGTRLGVTGDGPYATTQYVRKITIWGPPI